ncbi:hypothetical protein ABZW47_31400 [Streptomyces sp. NPDC004549]|uniref:hypothetical protein n=1 Tax=Streptomyces sp. NPDC004549 TaxID=3154283 RepID=UPI0033AD9551
MEQDPAAYLVREVRAALRVDTGVLDANALLGAVTEVWFDQHEARDAVRYWPRLVFADGTVVSDEALAPRRTERATWWPTVARAARQFLRDQPTRLSPLVVRTSADGTPARVDFASVDDWPDLTVRRLHREGPVVGRLRQILVEVEGIQAAVAEGSAFDLGEVEEALRAAIGAGEPAVRGPLPYRPAALATERSHETEMATGSESALHAARKRLEDLLAEHGSPAHPEVISQWIELAELTGKNGDPRAASALYDQLAKKLREHLHPHDARILDACEGVARWVAAQGRT